MSRRVFEEIGASKGVGVGKCLIIGDEDGEDEKRKKDSEMHKSSAPEDEIELFESVITHVERELQQIKNKVEADAGKDAAGVFEAQLLMLKDPAFVDDVEKRIRTKLLAAEEAVSQSVTYLREKFSSLSTEYMRERSEDVRDIGQRLIETLRGKHEDLDSLREEAERGGERIVLVSKRLAAATIAHFGRNVLAGIVSETGSKTSHLAIVARSLNIPAVLGVGNISHELKGGDLLLVNGSEGHVTVHPSEDEAGKAEKEMEPATVQVTSSWKPTETIDGHRVRVFANVADSEGIREAR